MERMLAPARFSFEELADADKVLHLSGASGGLDGRYY